MLQCTYCYCIHFTPIWYKLELLGHELQFRVDADGDRMLEKARGVKDTLDVNVDCHVRTHHGLSKLMQATHHVA
jgi:hypothetical protein